MYARNSVCQCKIQRYFIDGAVVVKHATGHTRGVCTKCGNHVHVQETTMTRREQKTVEIVSRNPGLDAIALKGKGWRPQNHASLRDLEKKGLLRFENGGWYVIAK